MKLAYGDGTVALDWSKIVHVESPQTFVVADKEENGTQAGFKVR